MWTKPIWFQNKISKARWFWSRTQLSKFFLNSGIQPQAAAVDDENAMIKCTRKAVNLMVAINNITPQTVGLLPNHPDNMEFNDKKLAQLCKYGLSPYLKYMCLQSCLIGWNDISFPTTLSERTEDVQVVNMVLYLLASQTLAESAFSEQKAMLRPRRSTMTSKNCSIRMVGSIKRYKWKLQSIMHARKKPKRE